MRHGCSTIIFLFTLCFTIFCLLDDKEEPKEAPVKWPTELYKEQEIPHTIPDRESYIPDSIPLRVNKEQQLIIDGKRYRVRQLANGDQQLILIR